ncbi:hypothetical protein DPMN_192544 [Dreissena polymorpha]|uniref:Uncharacterized protein n=1 Tax=Dreissena polymorpha TaxID=45954 RepID=A0A9D3Y3N5_DREPO|nr:hypothetical protein DPMN_192544 [Dreissena polymorpha]
MALDTKVPDRQKDGRTDNAKTISLHLWLEIITTDECCELEVFTRGRNPNERWFEECGKRIQSSNYHRICSATENANLAALASTMFSGHVIKQNEAMRHGCKFEKNAIHVYEREQNVQV